jgi:periplasmic copper chaperone A
VSRALPRPARTSALALALGRALTCCGAGFEAQTYQQRQVADGTNAAMGAVGVRNITVEPGPDRGAHEAGADAEVTLTLANDGSEDDRLVEVSSPDAESVDIVEGDDGDTVDSLDLPRLGTTGTAAGLVLRSLTERVSAGEFIEVTMRFERNGELTVMVPVATTDEYDYERERSDNFHPPGDEAHED